MGITFRPQYVVFFNKYTTICGVFLIAFFEFRCILIISNSEKKGNEGDSHG